MLEFLYMAVQYPSPPILPSLPCPLPCVRCGKLTSHKSGPWKKKPSQRFSHQLPSAASSATGPPGTGSLRNATKGTSLPFCPSRRPGSYASFYGRATGLRARRYETHIPRSIVGFLGTWYAADQAHIVSVGVADGYRRRGIGELLLIAAVEHAVARETETITLEVRKSNAAARTLYEKYGFVEQGIRKAYYSDNREDAVIMTKGSIQMERYAAQVAALKQAHQERWGRAEIDVGNVTLAFVSESGLLLDHQSRSRRS